MDVSIPFSKVEHSSSMVVLRLELGWMHRLTTSHITLRSSYRKCFSSRSTTYDITSGISKNSFACSRKAIDPCSYNQDVLRQIKESVVNRDHSPSRLSSLSLCNTEAFHSQSRVRESRTRRCCPARLDDDPPSSSGGCKPLLRCLSSLSSSPISR